MVFKYRQLAFHFKAWNEWRKRNLNSRLHKFLVLLGVVKSPTFIVFKATYGVDFKKAFEEGIAQHHKYTILDLPDVEGSDPQ